MNETEWREYYWGMVAGGSMKPAKEAEMVANCGGQAKTLVPDPADPQKKIEVVEPYEEAAERIRGEILEMGSRASLEKKADQIIAELRRRW